MYNCVYIRLSEYIRRALWKFKKHKSKGVWITRVICRVALYPANYNRRAVIKRWPLLSDSAEAG